MKKKDKSEIVSIDRLEAYLKIKETKGKFFSAGFIKKDKSIRTMICRLGVTKNLTGKGMSYNPIEKRVLPVFDCAKQSYRMINLKTVFMLKIAGVTYSIS